MHYPEIGSAKDTYKCDMVEAFESFGLEGAGETEEGMEYLVPILLAPIPSPRTTNGRQANDRFGN